MRGAFDVQQEPNRTTLIYVGSSKIRQELGWVPPFADAAHVAFAEAASASFISCDDKLLKKCVKTSLSIWSGDPLQFCFKERVK